MGSGVWFEQEVEEMEQKTKAKKLVDDNNEEWVSHNLVQDGEMSPGGSAQTKDYYNLENLPLQRRRRSFNFPREKERE